jgi:ABC-type glutathione transport system ATPase component
MPAPLEPRSSGPDVRRASDGPGAARPLLSFAGVAARRREGAGWATVLSGVSFELAPGERMGVYGERRSGKSTLLRLAAALQIAEQGRVLIDGRDPARLSADERTRLLRGPVALLDPDGWSASPGETVMDHVAMSAGSAGLSLREARRAALAALDRTGAAGVSAEEMTHAPAPAQRARILLARAIVRSPRLLLVDEPAPLPSLLERERFCALLRELAREREMALLVASEDLAALAGLERIASLSGGELSEAEPSGGQPGRGEPSAGERGGVAAGAVLDFPPRRAGGQP